MTVGGIKGPAGTVAVGGGGNGFAVSARGAAVYFLAGGPIRLVFLVKMLQEHVLMSFL